MLEATRQFGEVRAVAAETRRMFGGFSVARSEDRLQAWNDAEADLAHARHDARLLLMRGASKVIICRTRLKLPSGIVGWRFFALGETLTLVPEWEHHPGNAQVVERYQKGDMVP
jgi:hypothetical protein